MSFVLNSNRDLQNEIQNIIKEQLETAYMLLVKKELSISNRVHQIRKMCKRQRGLLQLIKPILKDSSYYHEQNGFYKDFAKLLAHSREAKVMLDMFEMIIKNYDLQKSLFSDIENTLTKEIDDDNFDTNELNLKLHICEKKLQQKIQNMEQVDLDCDSDKCLKIGFLKTYKKAKKYMKRAYEKLDIEDFHTFRKFSKYHMFHLNLLSDKSIFPKTREKQLKKLTDILGTEHDLTLFKNFLVENKKSLHHEKLLISYIQLEQNKLRKHAHKLENKLFKLSPKVLTQYAII